MPKGKKNKDPGKVIYDKSKSKGRKTEFNRRRKNKVRQFKAGQFYKTPDGGGGMKWYKATKAGNLVRVPAPPRQPPSQPE